ncbi:amidase signature enzyme [Coniophora puteana RWD-64-598 SS2]|uniref:amidase n=1 Tax=Coniophora puteana (strain RWD-64-598) TaxID=741705 RepID=A0A5M3MX23_CONPW|nr:amidase signature enzyme [Coniophora puteana RWD-64-598 SS2]EIW83689.1 amidase signature enzyme [Coniophora puteana RWD-64-598 SS2]
MFRNKRTENIAVKLAARGQALSVAGKVSEKHAVYLGATASEIADHISKGEWTATEVVEAFIARAALAQAKTNCLTEVLFADARRQAEELDDEFARTKQTRGPLHGVPVSFKDQFDIEGFDSVTGFSAWIGDRSKKNAFLVDQCRKAGAIIIAKTNVPQTMFAYECCNPVFGRTTNPWSDKHTCGGSSGGEAALLAMDGSALGVGSDIGGSLRIPTSYCGLYSLKPTPDRVSGDGTRGCQPGYEAVKVCYGPMARSIADCDLFCRMFLGKQSIVPDVPPVPYRDVELPKILRFGYYKTDGLATSSPACQRAVQETVDALQREGHECIEFDVKPLALEILRVFAGLATSDSYEKMLSHLHGDPQESSLFIATLGPKLPGFVRRLMEWAAQYIMGDKVFAEILHEARGKSVREFVEFTDARNKVNRAFYEQIWNGLQLDGIICPVQALPAIPHGSCAYLAPLATATVTYNVVESAVGVVPVTRVKPGVDDLPPGFKAGQNGNSKILETAMYFEKEAVYNPARMAGLPVGVQIVGRKWEDEKVLAMMRVVDEALGPRDFGPGTWKE